MQLSLSVYLALGFYVALIRPSAIRPAPSVECHQSTSTPAITFKESPKPEAKDINKEFRIAPQSFKAIDFENRSYGRYRLPSGWIDLQLKGGELYYYYQFEAAGWFRFEDVFYTDVTGDNVPEAIVMLSHVQCGGSCDGGASLIYIYAAGKHEPRRIWKYETGSTAYGCGLKSFSVENKQIVMEMFGRCPRQTMEYPGTGKFIIEDLTHLVVRFNGEGSVRSKLKFVSAPATDVKNYRAEIRIS